MATTFQQISASYEYSISMQLQDKVLAFRDEEAIKRPGEKVHFCRRFTATCAMGFLIAAHAIETVVRTIFALFAIPILYFSTNGIEIQHKRMYWIDSAIDHWKELIYRFQFLQKGMQETAFALEAGFITHNLQRSVEQSFRRMEMDRVFALFCLGRNTMFAKVSWLETWNSSTTLHKTEKALLKAIHSKFKTGNHLMNQAKTAEDFKRSYDLFLQFSELMKKKSASEISGLFSLFSKKTPAAFTFAK